MRVELAAGEILGIKEPLDMQESVSVEKRHHKVLTIQKKAGCEALANLP
jgi:hypothetical protein